MNEEETDKSIKIWRNFVDIWKTWYRKTGKNLAILNLTTTEFTVMRHLIYGGPQPMNALANLINVTPGWITGVIDKMESDGLVSRMRQESDRRIINIAITDRGRDLFFKAKKLHYEFVRESLKEMDENDKIKLLDLLEKMRTSINDSTDE
ncbi:MAG: MarR family winged helix-turn-helix transcriptional regulator [Thermoplasmata archaeon]